MYLLIDITPYFVLASNGTITFEVSDSHGHEGALLKSPSKQTAAKIIVHIHPTPIIPLDLLRWSQQGHIFSWATLRQ